MDDHRFDRLTQSLAGGLPRRRILAAVLAAGVAGLQPAIRARPVAGGRDREPPVASDEPPEDCLLCLGSEVCVAGKCCPAKLACWDVCCPPETIACQPPIQFPDGTATKAGCLCPDGFAYLNKRCATCPDKTTCAGGGCGAEQICLGNRCCGVYNAPCCTDDDCCFGHCSPDAICLCFHPGTPCDADDDCCIGGCTDEGFCETSR